MKFSWNRDSSFEGAVCMTITRVKLAEMDVDEAIRKTLANGFCKNPELISDKALRTLQQRVRADLEQSNRNTQSRHTSTH